MYPLTRLQSVFDQASGLVGRLDPAQDALATPCTEWNVGQVVNHMIGALMMFRDVARHGFVDPDVFSRELRGDDPARTLATTGAEAVAAWREDGRMAGTAKLPFGEFPAEFALQLPAMDMLLHSWDLATATGQEVDWDPELVADTAAFCEKTFTSAEFRGDDFAPPVPVPDDADEMSRLVGFMGRTP
jgi:uncharacterized protein (TIGR03086 family)